MSLSATARVWEGRGVPERKLDSIVWDRRQLYVVAQSNFDIHGFSNYGAAKNSLAVGAALDSGSLAVFSSHGPTADGRLAPQVVGTGVDLYSAAGDGNRSGYNRISGTSMASPAGGRGGRVADGRSPGASGTTGARQGAPDGQRHQTRRLDGGRRCLPYRQFHGSGKAADAIRAR